MTRAATRPWSVSEAANRIAAASSRAARQASPRTNRALKAMLVHAAVERGAGEAELLGGERDIVGMLLERLLDHRSLGALQIQVVAPLESGRRDERGGARRGAARQREILDGEGVAAGEDDGALGGVAERADVAGPVIGLQRRHDVGRHLAHAPGVFLGVEGQIMVDE